MITEERKAEIRAAAIASKSSLGELPPEAFTPDEQVLMDLIGELNVIIMELTEPNN